jgi:hypothetical protein
MSEFVSVFLNLSLFVGVFYLIVWFAGMPDRRREHTARTLDPRADETRVA